jgi:hypothetical protein
MRPSSRMTPRARLDAPENLEQFALAVAGDTGDADDLAGMRMSG